MKFQPSQPIWKPSNPAFTSIEVLRRAINLKHPSLQLKNYHDLHAYSVSDYQFWMDLWEHIGVVYSTPPQGVLVPGTSAERPMWFPGALFNYAENLLKHDTESIACTAVDEMGVVTNYSFRHLRSMVAEVAAALRTNGLMSGDRVAIIATNSVTPIVIALAVATMGGIYTSTAPDMGAVGVLSRYRQIRPKFLFTETEVVYAGRVTDLIPKVTEIIQGLRHVGLQRAILLPSKRTGEERPLPSLGATLSEFLASGDGQPLTFKQLPFNHPLCILYSSGTTGPPKCIVHCAGGILLQTIKDIGFCYGVGREDTLLQYTTTGWMMWNLMVAGLALGARLVVYDGSPFHPTPSSFMRVVKQQDVTVLGVSPRFLATLQLETPHLLRELSTESLRTVAVGGAVLSPALHEWAQGEFGPQTRVMTAMGGTDICTAFITSVLSLPVYAGEISCKAIGMRIEVFDPAGSNIEDTGNAGELVCTRPHPSVPLGFWGDESGEKFRDTYYKTYPGVWRQGDFVVVNPSTKGLVIHGRSDGVLNPSGIRFGSGEIYSTLERFQGLMEDYICVGQRRARDMNEQVLLFVKMRPGHALSTDLIQKVRDTIRAELSVRHVPKHIIQVKDIPYTINGKKIEVAIKQIVSGVEVTPSGAVANPESLEEYYQYRDIGSKL